MKKSLKSTYSFGRGLAVTAAAALCLGAFGTAAFAAQDASSAVAAAELDADNLADGKYTLTAEMIKTDRKSYSMANSAINHTVQLDVENGEYYITMQFTGLAIYNRFGYLQNLSYYDAGYSYGEYGKAEGTLVDANVLTTQKNADGTDVIDEFNDADNLYPEMVKFKLVDKASEEFVPLHVFVPIMEAISEGNGSQDVLMKLDWSALAAVEEDIVPETAAARSAAVDLADSATGVKVHADEGVFDDGVKLVVSKASVDSGVLSDAAKSFTAYSVSFTNADGSAATPNGTVTIYFPVGSLSADSAALYRINDDGTKTLVRGTVENGYFVAVQKSVGTYALVEMLAASGTSAQSSTSAVTSGQTSAGGSTSSADQTVSTSSVQTGVDSGAAAVFACVLAVGAAVFACLRRKMNNSIGE